MGRLQFLVVAFVAFAILASIVSGNECDCHVCGNVNAAIFANGFSLTSISGANTYSGTGIVDGSTFSLGDVVWIEGGGTGGAVGSAYYSNNLDLTASPAHDDSGNLVNPVTEITLPPAVQTAMDGGCFCPYAGMHELLVNRVLGAAFLNIVWLSNSTSLEYSCGAGTSESPFSVTAVGTGLGNWSSNANGFSAQQGFGHVSDVVGQWNVGSALFGTICSQCPTPEPTNAPTDNPTTSPTKAPTDIPTAAPTGNPTESPSKAPTGTPEVGNDPAFFEVQNNIYMVAGAGGGFLLLLLLLVLVRSRKKKSGTAVLSALPADVEDPETKPRKARGNAPDPNNSQSIRLEIDDEIFDWEKHIDKASGEVYFFNPKTGESRWEPPTIKKKT